MILVWNRTFDSECVQQLSREEYEKLADNFRRATTLHNTFISYINLPLAMTASLFTLTYACAIVRAMRNKSVSCKCYALILNRVAADLIFTLGTMASQFNDRHGGEPIVAEITDAMGVAMLWASMITYLTLAFLKLFAIFKPLDYRRHISMGLILKLIAFSWTLYAMALTAVSLAKAAACAQNGIPWFNCRFYLSRVKNIVNAGLYFSTICLFALTVVLIKRAKRRTAKISLPSARLDIKMPKLYAGMATFTLFYVPLIVAITVIVVNTATNEKVLPCLILERLVLLEWCLEAITVAFLARIGLDSLTGLYLDKRISNGLAVCSSESGETQQSAGSARSHMSNVRDQQ